MVDSEPANLDLDREKYLMKERQNLSPKSKAALGISPLSLRELENKDIGAAER